MSLKIPVDNAPQERNSVLEFSILEKECGSTEEENESSSTKNIDLPSDIPQST